jgi:hypothetical protein
MLGGGSFRKWPIARGLSDIKQAQHLARRGIMISGLVSESSCTQETVAAHQAQLPIGDDIDALPVYLLSPDAQGKHVCFQRHRKGLYFFDAMRQNTGSAVLYFRYE